MIRHDPASSSLPGRLESCVPHVAIVGAGIAGLSHAWAAAKRGWKVDVFERDPAARGASVRNFGMVWPIGQTNGPNYRTALLSRALWLEFLQDAQLWYATSGSLHLAYRSDEFAVLREFASISDSIGYTCQLLSAEEAAEQSSAVRSEEAIGALWSPHELNVNPRQVIQNMPKWLSSRYDVKFHFGKPISQVAPGMVRAVDGSIKKVDRVVVASSADMRWFYPDLYNEAGFRLCKLQMLRTVPQPNGWKLGPMLASGLTLRHYESFSICSSLAALKRRVSSESPELDDYGIHVMISQNESGELILGDSHEYGDEVSPFNKQLIDELILRELKKLANVPDWTIAERWHGVYPKASDYVEYAYEPQRDVHVIVPSGGSGMTMSFGLAEQKWQSWEPIGTSRFSAGNVETDRLEA